MQRGPVALDPLSSEPSSHNVIDDWQGRLYFLPFSQEEKCLCGKCFETGGLSDNKSRSEIFLSLDKAKRGEYLGVIFPCYLLLQDDAAEIMSAAKQRGLKVFAQVSAIVWVSEFRDTLIKLVEQGLLLNVILGRPGVAENEFISYTLSSPQYVYYTLVGENFGGLSKYVAQLPQPVLNQLHFYFPLDPIETRRMFLTPSIHESLRKISNHVRRKGKHLSIRGPKGVDIFEPHIPSDRDLEPELKPSFESQVATTESIEVSVIIPSFNCKSYIKNVVRHIFKQSLSPDKYEVIIVDDGSNDGTQEDFFKFVTPFQNQRNFRFLFFSRLTPRKRGDSQFRAGIARNVGVKHSRGRILLFLDSDMLIPANYLSDLISKMNEYEIVQGKRLFLNEDVSNELTSYNLIDPEIDTYPEDPYWASFQNSSDWNTLHNHWKYTCTHSLAVKAADFKRLGWFRKTFLYYGFEDVDLGYRLAKDGARFLLSDIALYHLHPPPCQSEYERSPVRRQMILAKTCRIFFHHSLDDSAYQDFRGLLAPTESFSIALPTISKHSTSFWFFHYLQMMKWRLMWFLLHPAPKSGVRLTGGLLRRTYWRIIWPSACWLLWRVKVISNWLYWRSYGLSHLLRWRVLGTLRWKIVMPVYYKGLMPACSTVYYRGLMPTYYKSVHSVYDNPFIRLYWRIIWPSLCWSFWRLKGLLLILSFFKNWAFWRLFELRGFLYCKVWGTFKWKIAVPFYQVGVRGFFHKILVPGLWLAFDLSLPLRKPFYVLSYQYRKRILGQTMEKSG